MKYNRTNRPKKIQMVEQSWEDYLKENEEWFEGFFAELRERDKKSWEHGWEHQLIKEILGEA